MPWGSPRDGKDWAERPTSAGGSSQAAMPGSCLQASLRPKPSLCPPLWTVLHRCTQHDSSAGWPMARTTTRTHLVSLHLSQDVARSDGIPFLLLP